MSQLIEVAFRGNRKEFFQWDGEVVPPLKSGVIVDADRGEDFGRIHSTGELAEVRCRGCSHGCGTAPPPRSILRIATPDEVLLDKVFDTENESTRRKTMERVKANGLVMKITDAEWQWDRRKLTIFFTAERRVDFRGLVRDLAGLFRTRIELKQIGVRDEAKRLSGIGRCGREYCSSSWLPELRPVNLGVAKDQKLSLNPQQISGACGRLMCCLRYEHEFYVQSRRRFPKEGKILQTSLGEERVISCDIFNERVTLRTVEGDARVVELAALRIEMDRANELLTDDDYSSDSDELSDYELEAEEFVAPELSRVDTPDTPDTTRHGADDIDVDIDTSETDASPEGGESHDDSDEPRRKRRRGRRGGRRLRAAEQRQDRREDQKQDQGHDQSCDQQSDHPEHRPHDHEHEPPTS